MRLCCSEPRRTDLSRSHRSDDKRYYADAVEVYGGDVETMVQEEDAQPLTEPIIAPPKTRKFRVVDKSDTGPETRYEKRCVASLGCSCEREDRIAVR